MHVGKRGEKEHSRGLSAKHILAYIMSDESICIVQWSVCTDKKENLIFLIYREIQSGAVAKSYMRKDFLIFEEMRKYFPIYEEAVSHIWLCNCSTLNFPINEEKLIFFLSVCMMYIKLQRKEALYIFWTNDYTVGVNILHTILGNLYFCNDQ